MDHDGKMIADSKNIAKFDDQNLVIYGNLV